MRTHWWFAYSRSMVRPEVIFIPVAVLALWTLAVLFLVGFRRVHAARSGRVSPDAFRLGESPEVPADVTVANRHLMNLLEVPVLFYVVVLGYYVTRRVDGPAIFLAFAFVLLRLVHSFIHLTSNRIISRLIAFTSSSVALLALWLWFLWRLSASHAPGFARWPSLPASMFPEATPALLQAGGATTAATNTHRT